MAIATSLLRQNEGESPCLPWERDLLSMNRSVEWLSPWNVLPGTKSIARMSHMTTTQVVRFVNDMATCILQSIDEYSWLHPLYSRDKYALGLKAATIFKSDNFDMADLLRVSADGFIVYVPKCIG